jgi:hypothetical protein
MNGFFGKIILNSIVIVPFLLWFSDASFLTSIVTSLAFSVLTYLLGDQILLRMTGNTLLLGSIEWMFHRYLRKADELNRIV